jgi:DNA polymerase I-like protein with 3'-5' exonuclease and polymerase domains
MIKLTLDLETSVKNKGDFAVGNFSGSPHHPDNDIVCACFMMEANDAIDIRNYGTKRWPVSDISTLLTHFVIAVPVEPILLIGQNIKFDLLYLLYKFPDVTQKLLTHPNVFLWDTQLAEYLLTGQADKMISLNKLSDRYGFENKDSRIVEFWDAGIDTEDIPRDMLVEYCEEDVRKTYGIYEKQAKEMSGTSMQKLSAICHNALKLTTIMEFNGMHFDLDIAHREAVPLEKEAQAYEDKITQTLLDSFQDYSVDVLVGNDVNAASNKQLGCYFFGGSFTIERNRRVLDDEGQPYVYKTGIKKGKVKTKKTEVGVTITEGIPLPDGVLEKLQRTPSGELSVNDTNLQILDKYYAGTLCKDVLHYRGLMKDLKTYYLGLSKLTWNTDSCIHGSIHHTNTNTGRLSSSAPNLQNITN